MSTEIEKAAEEFKNASPEKTASPIKEEKKKVYESKPRRHNVIIVRGNVKFKTLVIQAKQLLKTQFETIELHGVDDQSYLTISLVAQCLLKYKYVTVSRLKTKTVQIHEEDDTSANYSRLQPRLIIHLTKTKEFDKIFDEFEAVFQKVVDDHQAEADATAEANKVTSDVDEEK